ncbi:hypothetical protein WDV76_00660 [Xenorhabdus griffiniae]|uniref:hypothetical protein n=1 Tax=Xenorhabdus griffiniae TaxID=351672 RepID=UPI0030D1D1EC
MVENNGTRTDSKAATQAEESTSPKAPDTPNEPPKPNSPGTIPRRGCWSDRKAGSQKKTSGY